MGLTDTVQPHAQLPLLLLALLFSRCCQRSGRLQGRVSAGLQPPLLQCLHELVYLVGRDGVGRELGAREAALGNVPATMVSMWIQVA